jgi:Cytochrome c/c1 heme lyase
MMFNHPAPFDRHDWVVDRGGQEVRYIIDYYHDESAVEKDQNPKHLHDLTSMRSIAVDVRPALDSVEALFARFIMMPFATLRGSTTYNPPPFFPTRQMTVAEEHKDARIARNWADIITKCAVNKDALAACDSEESCGAASVALQRCMSSVVCPSVSLEFDKCVAATPQNDSLTGAAFNAMIKCIEVFEMDSKQIHQQKKLAAGK